jgi:ferredoxin
MVDNEDIFLNLCLRCGECIKSCPTGALQPLFLEGGFSGLWSPAITPRIGGCKDNCNACSLACPTNAIPEFGPKRTEKWSVKMGTATFEPAICITYQDDAIKPCLKCVEVCPNKAIEVDCKASPVRPVKVHHELCIGCGLCEHECLKMVSGRPAIQLTSNDKGTLALLAKNPKPLKLDEKYHCVTQNSNNNKNKKDD